MTELTCIVCPIGCRIRVNEEFETLNITGNRCPRGAVYAKNEIIAPKRILTAVVKVAGINEMLSVKTSEDIPKEKIFTAMQEIKKIIVDHPVKIGQVIKRNLVGTNVDLVATKNISSP